MALNKGSKNSTIFMDLSTAFDTVWYDGLIYNSMNLPSTIIRWMDRTTKIKIGERFWEDINIKRGVPQGDALSQILYFIYVNNTPIAAQNHTKVGLFANDTAYWTNTKTTRSNIQNLQETEKKKSIWCKTHVEI